MMHKFGIKLSVFATYLAATAAWAASVLLLPNSHVREVLSIGWLLWVPGYALWRSLVGQRIPRVTAKVAAYVLGLSILSLMMIGLVLNQIYVFLGDYRPLTEVPLTVAISGTTIMLGAIAALRTKRLPSFSIRRKIDNIHLNPLTVSVGLAGLSLPITTILGAITLNNGGTGGIAVAGMGATVALFLLMLFRERDLGKYYGYLLYCMCASILFATSMRGWNITGHDVMEEYQVFQLTLSHATWHMSYYHDAYMACLSITVLPTIIQKLSGVYAPYVFKFVFQAIAGLIAVVLYGSLREHTNKRTALLATFLFMTFPTFITDIAMLNRQEMGMLFFALIIHVGTNKQLARKVKSILVFLFMVGMILSHYSTSYVAIGAMIVAFFGAYFWKYGAVMLRRKNVPKFPAYSAIVSPAVLVGSLLTLVGWGAITTQTSSNIQQTLQAIVSEVSGKHISTSTTLLDLSTPTASQFSDQALKGRDLLSTSTYYSNTVLKKYPLQSAEQTIQALSKAGQVTHLPETMLGTAYDLMRNGYAALILGGFAIGLIYCLLQKRNGSALPRQYMLIAVGTLVLIGLQVVLPNAIDYGLTRMLQQALIVFSLPVILAALWILRLVRIPRHISEGIIGGILAVFFLILSGAIPSITGGYKPSLTTANSGFYYAAYYTHQDEVAAAQWLAKYPAKGSQVYSDEFMRRKLITYGTIFSQPLLTPVAIPQDSYVMLSYSNLEFDQVPAYDNGVLIYYKPPLAFLQQNKDLVYSSNNIQIYK